MKKTDPIGNLHTNPDTRYMSKILQGDDRYEVQSQRCSICGEAITWNEEIWAELCLPEKVAKLYHKRCSDAVAIDSTEEDLE